MGFRQRAGAGVNGIIMKKIFRNLSHLSAQDLKELFDQFIGKMSGDPAYATLAMHLATLVTAYTAWKTSDKAVTDNETDHPLLVGRRNTSRDALDTAYGLFVTQVEAALPSPDAQAAAGFKMVGGNGGPVGRLDAPTRVSATAGDDPGCIDIGWDAEPRSSFYRAERATSGDGPWTTVYQDTKSSFTDRSCTPGTLYFYRAFNHNAAGDSPVSDITSRRAP